LGAIPLPGVTPLPAALLGPAPLLLPGDGLLLRTARLLLLRLLPPLRLLLPVRTTGVLLLLLLLLPGLLGALLLLLLLLLRLLLLPRLLRGRLLLRLSGLLAPLRPLAPLFRNASVLLALGASLLRGWWRRLLPSTLLLFWPALFLVLPLLLRERRDYCPKKQKYCGGSGRSNELHQSYLR